MRYGVAVLVAVVAACSQPGEPAATVSAASGTLYASASWENYYRTGDSIYRLDSVRGQLFIERDSASARVWAARDVWGWFTRIEGQDTSWFSGVIWRSVDVLQGKTTPGSVFSFETQGGLWPTSGVYRIVGDTLFFENANSSSVMRVSYAAVQ